MLGACLRFDAWCLVIPRPRIAVKHFGQELWRAARAFEMPLAVLGNVFVVERPGIEWLIAQCAGELAGIHRYVASPRGQWPGFDSHTAVEECRIVAANAV